MSNGVVFVTISSAFVIYSSRLVLGLGSLVGLIGVVGINSKSYRFNISS